MTAEFTLSLDEYERNDTATGDFLNFRAAVSCRGFTGQTAFWVARRDIDAFIVDLAALGHGGSDCAQLLGGWEEAEERLRLRIMNAGRSGQFSSHVRIASTGPRQDQWNRVETDFICPPDGLSEFLAGLRRLVDQRARGDAVLAGDPEAIA